MPERRRFPARPERALERSDLTEAFLVLTAELFGEVRVDREAVAREAQCRLDELGPRPFAETPMQLREPARLPPHADVFAALRLGKRAAVERRGVDARGRRLAKVQHRLGMIGRAVD